MFGKLVKYELRACFKKLGLLWIAATVVLVINAVTLGLTGDPFENDTASAVFVLSILLQYITCIAIMIMSFVYIITRFYKGLLKDEGYLMFTLPVTTGQLIGSKLVAAVIVQLIATVSAILPFVAFAFTGNEFFAEMKDVFAELFREIGYQFETSAVVVMFFVMMLVSTVESLLRIYLSMAIGHLAKKHRVLCSIGAYIGMNYALNIISTFSQLGMSYTTDVSDVAVPSQITGNPEIGMIIVLAIMTLIYAGICVGEFFIIRGILTKKLNLD